MKGNSKLFGITKNKEFPSGITESQKKRIQDGYRKINDHISDKDIEGAKRDINGNPITNKFGIPFQHFKEVDDAINGLIKERDSLIKSLSNPNLSQDVVDLIKKAIKDFDKKIIQWGKIKKGSKIWKKH